MEDSVLIETNKLDDTLECEYFVQVGAYGNKKYAYEAVEMLNEVEFMTINDIYSASKPGKLLHSVLSGPYENRSAANNAKEKITKNGFDPQSLAVVAVMTLWSAFHSCETIARTINFSLRK